MSAVKFAEPVPIAREMGRSPIQYDADPRLMKTVDERHEIIRRAIPAGRRKISERLISPRTVERVLHHGHEFHMRIIHPLHIWNELVGQLSISEPAIALFGHAPPGPQVDLVNGNGRG